MSFDILVSAFENYELLRLPLEVLENAFGAFVVRHDRRRWTLRYGTEEAHDDTELTVGLATDDPKCWTGFILSTPTTNPQLYEDLSRLMRVTQCVAYCSWSGPPPVVGQARTLQHLPPDMAQTLGAFVIAHDGRELRNIIYEIDVERR